MWLRHVKISFIINVWKIPNRIKGAQSKIYPNLKFQRFSGHKIFVIYKSRFVEQRLMLRSSFRCDQIYKNTRDNFGHTLLCYLSPT